MTTNLDAIAEILTQENIAYELDREKSRIYLAAELGKIGRKAIVIRVIGNGDILEIEAPGLFQVNEKVFKGIFMQKLLELQGNMSLLKFYHYTLKNGEQWIGVFLEFPLFDNPLTSEQLFSCLSHLTAKLKEFIPRLQHILATGNEPPQKSELEQLLDDMSPEAVEKLARLLENRKQS